MLPSDHPESVHRNLVGMQRAIMLTQMRRQAAELHQEGYAVDGDQMFDKASDLRAEWTAETGAD